jgi:hypothetical protein
MRHERIEINLAIVDGKPVIRGTRVPVELHRRLGLCESCAVPVTTCSISLNLRRA